ncbi:uncharacterized protein LOC131935981 [Physella acuta]|uniref:uncharacterized protein LOC131935981 n=1 Tax=Physella acuta TaxID=109671 RepID=UPI0027DC810D|nr:uncharacterized protein LOC131935981 [Physella acuta]
MAPKTERTVQLSFFVFLTFIEAVDCYYCDNDKCTEEEYCCGDNTCCPSYKVWDLWYFWCGVLFFMFLLSLCACLWRYRLLSNGTIIISGYSYSPLQEVDSMAAHQDFTTIRFTRNGNEMYEPHLGTPPPYNQASTGNVKVAGLPPSYAQVVGMRETH